MRRQRVTFDFPTELRSIAICAPRRTEPKPELPLVAAARERDRQARAALRSGKRRDDNGEADFATKIMSSELDGARHRRRR